MGDGTMRARRVTSLIFIVVGALLLLSGAGYALVSQVVNHPSAAPLPEQLAGLPLVHKAIGQQAVDEIARLHGRGFPLSSAAVGVYGLDGEATLWVSGAPLKPMATRMLLAMRDRIAQGNSPFTPVGEHQDGPRTIYELDGMGQKHYYFQSENLVVWLAVDPPLAEAAMKHLLEVYP